MKPMSETLAKLMDARQLSEEYVKTVKAAVADPEVQRFLQAHASQLQADAVNRGAAKIYEFVTQRDKVAHGEVPLAPGYAPQLVVANGLIDITYVATAQKIAQDALAEQQALVTAINVPKTIRSASIDTYDSSAERAEAAVAAVEFIDAVVAAPNQFHQGLYLTGPFGVGKTYLLGAIANDIAKDGGIASTLLHVPTFAVEMKAAIGSNQVLPKLDRMKRAPVLMLDDIGAESFSPWFRDDVLGVLLQYRMQEELPTLFSSNKTMAQLEGFLAGHEANADEPVKAARIMERIRFLATEVVVGGVNRRLH